MFIQMQKKSDKRKLLTCSLQHSSSLVMPAKSVIMLSLDINTPLGSPVVPLVYIIVHMSLFFFTGRSKLLSWPYDIHPKLEWAIQP
jgi:hypothetical protein